jgi:MGT family glycosyltransferase
MTKYVFLGMPAYGHVNPSLPVVQELVKRGQNVIYYLPEHFKSAVQATGAVFRSYESRMKDMLPMVTSSDLLRGRLAAMMIDESRHVLPQVLDRIRAEKPDCIVYESMCAWGRIAVEVLNVPAMTLRPTYAMNERVFFMMAQQRSQNFAYMREMMGKIDAGLAELCEIYHVPPLDMRSVFASVGQFCIVFIPKEFQPFGDTFDECYLFVGPSILPRHAESDFPLDKLSNEHPILYISLGTVFNNQPEFFKMCFEAFGGQSWQVVLSRGRHVDPAALGPVPDNFLVAPYVPQLEILPRTQVFVTHSGMNSTMESLYYGVPMVAIPQMVEQAMTAQRIAEMGLGVMLEKEAVNATMLCEAVERVANEASFRERAQSMQRVTREAGGYLRAADAIMQFAEEHAKVR